MSKNNKKAKRVTKSDAAGAVRHGLHTLFEASILRNAANRSDGDQDVLNNIADQKVREAFAAIDFVDDYFSQKAA